MTWLLLVLACGGEAAPPTEAGEPDLAAQVAALEQRVAALEGGDDESWKDRFYALEERVAAAELAIRQLEYEGVIPATSVGFDPRATTLEGENVQEALDQVEDRVSELEDKLQEDMGEPGPGLFEIPRDRGDKMPPGPQHGGPSGPGGQPQGGPPPGAPPGGGGQPGSGGPQGQQR